MKCLFLIKNYDERDNILEFLLIDEKDVKKVDSTIGEYDALDCEEKEKYGDGVEGALEYLKQKGIEFETLMCGGAYWY